MPESNDRIAAAVSALAEAFGRELTDAGLTLWVRSLNDLAPESIEQAVMSAVQSSRFMPTVADIRELSGVARHEDRAALAWVAVEKAVSRLGAYKTVNFDDPTINAAIRSLGGWPVVCGKPADEFEKWTRAEFVKTYAALSRSGVTGEMCDPLPGLAHAGEVQGSDGTVERIEVRTYTVRTGLPWAGERPKLVGGPAKPERPKAPMPRLEFRKP